MENQRKIFNLTQKILDKWNENPNKELKQELKSSVDYIKFSSLELENLKL